ISVFGPLQRLWSKQCEDYCWQTGEGIQWQHVVQEYMKAWEKAFMQANILEAWWRTGIHPFNPDIFSAADYAPSNVSSTSDQLPMSYP
ncbi:hypothetical protein EDC04DRAFT_2528469, partial [Pisolithus marmoratus]